MATEPLLVALRDHAVAALGKMSRANGFWYDYGDVILGRAALWQDEADYARPDVFFAWRGKVGGDAETGDEDAAGRQRHYEIFEVSIAIKDDDGDVERKAWRVRSDIEKAMMSADTTLGLTRSRGSGRATTYEEPTLEWESDLKEGTGGVLTAGYIIRWDHATGNMGSAT